MALPTKKFLVTVICCVVLLFSVFSGNAEAGDRTINYGVLQRDTELGCSKKHPAACRVPEANPYNRGCNPQLGCRTTPSAS
ncbi:hypothetical protein S83_026057 [Arachis hypogaea]